jgi:hypothetical protein
MVQNAPNVGRAFNACDDVAVGVTLELDKEYAFDCSTSVSSYDAF